MDKVTDKDIKIIEELIEQLKKESSKKEERK